MHLIWSFLFCLPIHRTPPKWQKNDLVSGGHDQAGSWRGQWTGWIGSAPVQISGCGLDGALSWCGQGEGQGFLVSSWASRAVAAAPSFQACFACVHMYILYACVYICVCVYVCGHDLCIYMHVCMYLYIYRETRNSGRESKSQSFRWSLRVNKQETREDIEGNVFHWFKEKSLGAHLLDGLPIQHLRPTSWK